MRDMSQPEYKKTGVTGHPVGQSLSPLIHEYWMDKYDIRGTYNAVDIAPENLGRDIRGLVDSGYKGWNVTVPHKAAMLQLCDVVEDEAQSIGAVNTVTVGDDGRLTGQNTDVFGFLANLNDQLPDGLDQGRKCIVLGAGGAARAVIYALRSIGMRNLLVLNRTQDKARDLAQFFNISYAPWHERDDCLSDTTLIVNTTSLGMEGQPGLDLDMGGCDPDASVYDIVYKPLMTPLLQSAKAHGCTIITGLGMLLHQARPGFARWHGIFPDVDDKLLQKVMP